MSEGKPTQLFRVTPWPASSLPSKDESTILPDELQDPTAAAPQLPLMENFEIPKLPAKVVNDEEWFTAWKRKGDALVYAITHDTVYSNREEYKKLLSEHLSLIKSIK